MNLLPKVLIAAPTSLRHGHLLNEWIDNLNKLTYPNFDVLLVDTTLEDNKYYERLKKKVVVGKKIKVLRHKWNPDKQHPIQMLADAREKIRHYFLEHDYDNLFWLDDDIFIPNNSIQRLLSYNRDAVGFYVHVFYKPHRVPCVLKSGEIVMGKGLEYYSFAEINEYKKFVRKFKKNELTLSEKHLIPFIIKDYWHPQLFKAYGVGIGCLMTSKKINQEIPFRTHPSFIFGEDLWFFAEANDKHFDFWVDTDVRAIHKNTEWNSVISKSKRRMGFYLAQGPADAKEAVILKRNG